MAAHNPALSPITIGIIAGTPFDTQLGARHAQNLGFKTTAINLSTNPTSQTLLQSNQPILEYRLKQAIDQLITHNATAIVIYCNSISTAVDMANIESSYEIPIFSPVSLYNNLNIKSRYVGLLAANCQSLGNIEKIILHRSPVCEVIGIGLLPVLHSIETNAKPIDIIKQHHLVNLCRFLMFNDCQDIILGCTHFEYFWHELNDELKKNDLQLNLIPLFDELFHQVLTYLQKEKKLLVNPS